MESGLVDSAEALQVQLGADLDWAVWQRLRVATVWLELMTVLVAELLTKLMTLT